MENIVLYLLRGSLVMSKCKQSNCGPRTEDDEYFLPYNRLFPSHSEATAESIAQSYSAMSHVYIFMYFSYVFVTK